MAKDDPSKVLIPCYGGKYDGRFFSPSYAPLGYRLFDVRTRKVYLWKTIRVERIDFDTLARASRLKPSDEDLNDLSGP